MPTICNDCRRFLVEDDGEGYLQHLEQHNQVQEELFGERWLRDVAIGDCRYIARHNRLYEYNKDGWWYDSGGGHGPLLPAIRHHEWMPL